MNYKDIEKEFRDRTKSVKPYLTEKGYIDFIIRFFRIEFNQVIDDMIERIEGLKECNHDFLTRDGICKKCSKSDYNQILEDQSYHQGLANSIQELKEYKVRFNK